MAQTPIDIEDGLIVAFEGIDGAGKTTQANRLKKRLERVGLQVELTKEPTNGSWGQKIRKSAQNGRMEPEEELHAFIKDRKQHVQQTIKPAQRKGKVVIVDRYYLSTVAYQGARGLKPQEILTQNETFAPQPDVFVLLDVEPETGLDRLNERDTTDLFEKRQNLRKAAEIFRSFTSKDYILHLDGARDIETIHQDVCDTLYWGALFQNLCYKGYLDKCEPAFCSFRNRCGYPEMGLLAQDKVPQNAWPPPHLAENVQRFLRQNADS